MAAMEIDDSAVLGASRLRFVNQMLTFLRVAGKHGRDEEAAGSVKKVHVDTNAVTRKGVEDDFESLLRFYYGAQRELKVGAKTQTAFFSHTAKVFPFGKMWKWMSYGNGSSFVVRTPPASHLAASLQILWGRSASSPSPSRTTSTFVTSPSTKQVPGKRSASSASHTRWIWEPSSVRRCPCCHSARPSFASRFSLIAALDFVAQDAQRD